jgi:hypothetical protein
MVKNAALLIEITNKKNSSWWPEKFALIAKFQASQSAIFTIAVFCLTLHLHVFCRAKTQIA